FPVRIDKDGFVILHIKGQGNVFFGGVHLQELKGGFDQFDDIEILPAELDVPYLEFGDQVQVLYNIDQSVHPLTGPLQVFLAELLVIHGPVQKGEDIALYREQGGLELVGHIAQKVPSVLLADLQGIDLDFLSLGKPFDFLGKGHHVRGHRSGKGSGLQEGNIIIDLFDTPVDEAFHPGLYDHKTKEETEGWEQERGHPVHPVPQKKKNGKKNGNTKAYQIGRAHV